MAPRRSPELLAALSVVASALMRARVRLACEVRQRGLHTAEGMSLVDSRAISTAPTVMPRKASA